jgi:hypothetical protein
VRRWGWAAALGVLLALAATPAPTYEVTLNELPDEKAPADGFIVLADPPLRRGDEPLRPPPRVHVDVAPAPTEIPGLVVSATGSIRVRLEPTGIGFGTPRLFPDADIERAEESGPFTIEATIGPPVNRRSTIAGFAYAELQVGCAFGTGGVRLDSSGTLRATDRLADADMFITVPRSTAAAAASDPRLPRCPDAFVDAAATRATLHVPGGAVVVAAAKHFPALEAREWGRSPVTTFDARGLRGTLLWRARDGRLVKTRIDLAGDGEVAGPTLAADAAGCRRRCRVAWSGRHPHERGGGRPRRAALFRRVDGRRDVSCVRQAR